MRNGERPRAAGGFTYVGLVILVAIIALVAATTVRVGVTLQRAQAERDLLHIGEQFANALKSYAAATPAGQPQQPPTLKDLLKDPRFPGTRRHLRKIFVDPMTGKAEWGIRYMAEDKGILGIYSLSTAKAIKISNFPSRFQSFNGKQLVSEWIFTFDGQEPLPPGQTKPGQGGQQTSGMGNQTPAPPGTAAPATPTTAPGTGTPPKAPEPADPADNAPAEPVVPPEPPAQPAEPAEPQEPAEPGDPVDPTPVEVPPSDRNNS